MLVYVLVFCAGVAVGYFLKDKITSTAVKAEDAVKNEVGGAGGAGPNKNN